MVTLAELSGIIDDMLVPKVERSDLRILWHSKYWNGAVNGMLLYQERKYWFEMVDEPEGWESIRKRRFHIIELTDEQMDELLYWHARFKAEVGDYRDYDEQGRRYIGALKPMASRSAYYEAYRNRSPIDLSQNQVIGWFTFLKNPFT